MKIFLFILGFTALQFVYCQDLTPSALKAIGAPNNPKVEILWNRYYDYAGIEKIMFELKKAYPELCRIESAGKSYGGKELYVMTITNFGKGSAEEKPGFYIAGAIHANEAQGTEAALYTAWFLLENYSQIPFIKKLVDSKTFFIVPMQSPDSRDKFLKEASSANSPRSGQVPRDDDSDGLINEDFPEDLNGDGNITQMRVKSSSGRWKVNPEFPYLMERCAPGEKGKYDLYWSEGIDNDGDGKINEDADGYYDPNRNWGWLWRPNYIQNGSDRFPFSLPETYALSHFVITHPNILASQSYHNSGGMITIGPNQNSEDYFDPEDKKLYDFTSGKGLQMLPGYRYINTYKDFYAIYGDETNWQYSLNGIMSFVNELWTPFNYFRKKTARDSSRIYTAEFNKYLLFGEAFSEWEKVVHPSLGIVEVGGMKKQFGRMPPSFLLEEECHRNMAFTLFLASNLPELDFFSFKSKRIAEGILKIEAEVINKKFMPTRLAVDIKRNINRPDFFIIKNADVISGGLAESQFSENVIEQKDKPEKLKVRALKGNGIIKAIWIIKDTGKVTLEYNSLKGGRIVKKFNIQGDKNEN